VSGLEAETWRVQSRIGQYETFALVCGLAVLTGFSLLFAWRQPFSVDEYMVRQTALSGSPAAVWHILRTAPLAVDPPLYHFLNVYCLLLFGPSEFSTRLLSVLAYTVMSFFLYRLVRKYTDVCTGLVLVALCLQCGAFSFAYEARPYSLVLAADAMALVCWASLVEERKKQSLALAGLFLGIAICGGKPLVRIPCAAWMAVALLILGGYASFSRYYEVSGMPSGGDTSTFADASALSAHPELPVVPGDNDLFFRLEAHGPETVRERCVFPTDPSFVRLLHQNTNFLMPRALRRWTKLPFLTSRPS